MSTSASVFYPPAAEVDRTLHVTRALEEIQKSRKAWKNLKGNKDLVWPSHLERALLEGLELYTLPEGSLRSTKQAQRYPLRNRHVSDYILETCGEKRTPKQIGSRIQQLRDTCSGEELMSILSPDQNSPKPYTGGRSRLRQLSARTRQSIAARRQASSESLRSSASTSSLSEYTPSEYTPSLSPSHFGSPPPESATLSVVIDILPEIAGYPCTVAVKAKDSPAVPGSMLPSTFSANPATTAFHPSTEARSIRAIDPSVTFISQEMIDAHASWSVYALGASSAVHTEHTPLVLSHQVDGGYHYSTNLVPTFWSTLCDSADPTRYTIEQDIVRTADTVPIFSATYKFQYPSSPAPSDSASSGESSESDYSSLFSFQPEFAMDSVYDQLCTENVGTYEPIADNWLNGLPSGDQYLELFTPYGGVDASADAPQHYYDEFASSSPTSSCFSSTLSDYLL